MARFEQQLAQQGGAMPRGAAGAGGVERMITEKAQLQFARETGCARTTRWSTRRAERRAPERDRRARTAPR
jgi:hypothetical protein